MKKQKLLSVIIALMLILSSAVTALAADSEPESSIRFLNEHKDIISPFYSLKFELMTEKLSSDTITEEERQQLTENIIELRKGIENCLEGKHELMIALPDMEGPFDCTSLAECEFCTHREIVLTGDGYRENHRDKDNDGICDDCKREMPYLNCNHFCHSENIIVKKIVLPIFRFLWNLLGIEEYCDCGTYHFGI